VQQDFLVLHRTWIKPICPQLHNVPFDHLKHV